MRRLAIAVLFFALCQTVFSQNFVQSWGHTFKNSLNSINKSKGLQIDAQGNCYVLGTTWLTDSAKDIILLKYDTSGQEVWRRIYDNPAHGDDIPMNMCLDREGNIWICGMAKLKEDNADFLVVKFNSDGIPIADAMFDGKSHLFDCANFIQADRAGNVYAAGYETSLDSGINLIVAKYRQNGSFAWRRSYSTRQMDVANKLVIDDSCNVYVCGTVNNGPHTADIILQKYDSTGKRKWQLVYDGLLSQNDAGIYLSMDDSVNLFLSGFINHTNSRGDIPLIKVSRNGQIISDIYYNGRIADCGAVDIEARKTSVSMIGMCNDYNVAQLTSFFIQYEKSGKQRFKIDAPADVQFLKYDESIHPFVLGTRLSRPESTLIPYVASVDSGFISWSFSDSSVYGLAHITDIFVSGGAIYFLGDDTGDATGTISVFKYILAPEVKQVMKMKTPAKKNR